MAVTYNDLYLDTRKRMKKMGVAAAQLEARELICAASGKTREQLFQDMPLYAPNQVVDKLEKFITRRIAGEPVAYLVGEWEFYGVTLEITPEVLIPRPDTEVLAERAIRLLKEAGESGRLLDLCCGSGCIGLAAAAQVPECRAVLVDLSEGAVKLAKQNIRRNNLTSRVTCFSGDAMGEPDSALWNFDVITCNPPYIPTEDIEKLDASVRDYEPRMALDGGADGLDFFRAVATGWEKVLRPGGTLLFEVGIGQAERVKQILTQAGYEKVSVHRDLVGIPRVVEGRVKLHGEDPKQRRKDNG